MHFNPIALRPFSKGGGAWDAPPRLYIDSDPPAFIGLKTTKEIFSNISLLPFTIINKFNDRKKLLKEGTASF